MKLRLIREYKSIKELNEIELPNFVVLTGMNGTGKTQLLKGINEGIIIPYENEMEIISDNNPYYKNGQRSSQYIDFKGKLNNTNMFSTGNNKSFYIDIIDTLNETGQLTNIIKGVDYQHSLEKRQKISEVKTVFEKSNINYKHFTYNDFLVLKDKYLNKNNLFCLPNFSSIISSYYERKLKNEYDEFLNSRDNTIKFLTNEEFNDLYGRDPVDVFNDYLKLMSDKYAIEKPSYREPGTSYKAKLINVETRDSVELSDLSTGETIFFQLLATLFNNDSKVLNIPKIILLDEMDAGLHPSLIRKLLDDIKRIFINEMGLTIIMTTHSPTTVALCDESSLYIMSDDNPRLRKISKQAALDILTIGIPTLKIDYDYRRQVLVESKYDAQNYEAIYKILKDNKYLISDVGLTFISSGASNSEQTGSCSLVKALVKGFCDNGNDKVYGIIDYDNKNSTNVDEHIYCLAEGKRYSIENCLLDPLVIGFLLIIQNFSNNYSLPILKIPELEKRNDLYPNIVEKIIDILGIDKVDLKDCSTIGGYHYKIPSEFLVMNGHELEELYKEKIPELKRFRNTNSLINETVKIFNSYEKIIPQELCDIFNLIN